MNKVPDSAELYMACQSSDAAMQEAACQSLWAYLYQVTFHVVRDQPSADGLAQECAQIALIRVLERIAECQEPATFQAWARRIAAHIAIDELRRGKRLVPLLENEPDSASEDVIISRVAHSRGMTESGVSQRLETAELYQLIRQAPISERSYRVVVGRYRDDLPDEQLAQDESVRSGRTVLPSHIQVTRAKNMAKLRTYEPLSVYWQERNTATQSSS